MNKKEQEVIIIGAGLTGLSLAYYLQQRQQAFILLEARNRLGGRILTTRSEQDAPLELGATWLGKKHTELVNLLAELKLDTFPQVTGGRAIYEAISTSPPQVVQLPHNDEPSYRIAGGSDQIIQALAAQVPADKIVLDCEVKALDFSADEVKITTSQGDFVAQRIVSTLPPYLLLRHLRFTPALPDSFTQIAAQTHTWMGESIKVGLRYAAPFWRENGAPGGTIFSNVGPVSEMYDHTSVTDDHFALKGFLNGAYYALSRAERRDMVLQQLRKYYGDVVDDYEVYEEGVWRQEPYTFTPYANHVLPHQHNGHPVFRNTFYDGKFIVAGSETASLYPGYMDGAVRSAQRANNQLKAII
ncbi:MAG: NAD(P)/FAD-dependent oxidoreductase [Bacteroidota bacterium]